MDFGVKFARFHNGMKDLSEKKYHCTGVKVRNVFDQTQIFGKFEKLTKNGKFLYFLSSCTYMKTE